MISVTKRTRGVEKSAGKRVMRHERVANETCNYKKKRYELGLGMGLQRRGEDHFASTILDLGLTGGY